MLIKIGINKFVILSGRKSVDYSLKNDRKKLIKKCWFGM